MPFLTKLILIFLLSLNVKAAESSEIVGSIWPQLHNYLSVREVGNDAVAVSEQVAEVCDGMYPRECLLFMAERLLLHSTDASRNSELNNFAIFLAHQGEFSAAEHVAAQIGHSSVSSDDSGISEFSSMRANAQGHIALIYAENLHLEEALRVLNGIDQRANNDRFVSDLVTMVFRSEYDHQTQFNTLSLLADIQEAFQRDKTAANIAVLIAELGNIPKALELIAAIQAYPVVQDDALVRVTTSLLEAGDAKQAERVALTVESDSYQSAALLAIVDFYAQESQFEDAERVSNRILDTSYQISSLLRIAIAKEDWNEADGANVYWIKAQQLANRLGDQHRKWVLHDISLARLQAGHSHESGDFAFDISERLDSFESEFDRNNVLNDMIKVSAEAGLIAYAEELLAYHSNEFGYDLGVHLIINSLIDAKEFSEAARIAKITIDELQRMEHYMAIGSALSRDGQYTEALELQDKIESTFPRTRDSLLRNIARDLVFSNMPEDAESIFLRMNNMSDDFHLLGDIASAYIAQNNESDADRLLLTLEHMAKEVDNELQTALILLDITRLRAMMGQFAKAGVLASGIAQEQYRARAFANIALSL